MTPRVGIAGYGLAGRYFHAPFLKAADFEVVGALTTKPERKAAAISDFPEISVVESIEELLKLNLDLLVVASANSAHASQAIAGLKAGVPVVVDKPMGRTLKETKEIVDFSKQVNVPVTTYFNRKWDSDALTIKKIIKEGILGNIFRLDSRFERYRPDLNPESWRENQTAIEGGGNLLDLQPHLVSTALDWFGPANLISASVRSLRGGSDDDVTLVLEHASGVDSYLSVSSINAAPGPRIRITGSKGSLVINEIDPQEPLLKSGKHPKNGKWSESTKSEAFLHLGDKVISYPSIDGNYSLFYIQVKQALSGGDWPVTTDEALSVAEIIDKAREISFR
jgi:scyllo-inositol 2-dehydrogenase (NADP+)